MSSRDRRRHATSDLFAELESARPSLTAGCDEVGRGPLAGPVVAAAVILDVNRPISGLRDSKQLSAAQRSAFAEQIKRCALAHATIFVDAEVIDRLNILQASLWAMEQALRALDPQPELALIDGNRLPRHLPCRAEAIVKGDQREPAIAAASILAKVARDAWMQQWHTREPDYGFARHMGYPTPEHLRALEQYGPGAIHRRSFAPVKAALSRARDAKG